MDKYEISWELSKIMLNHLFVKELTQDDKFDIFGIFGFYMKR